MVLVIGSRRPWLAVEEPSPPTHPHPTYSLGPPVPTATRRAVDFNSLTRTTSSA